MTKIYLIRRWFRISGHAVEVIWSHGLLLAQNISTLLLATLYSYFHGSEHYYEATHAHSNKCFKINVDQQ